MARADCTACIVTSKLQRATSGAMVGIFTVCWLLTLLEINGFSRPLRPYRTQNTHTRHSTHDRTVRLMSHRARGASTRHRAPPPRRVQSTSTVSSTRHSIDPPGTHRLKTARVQTSRRDRLFSVSVPGHHLRCGSRAPSGPLSERESEETHVCGSVLCTLHMLLFLNCFSVPLRSIHCLSMQ